MLKKTTLIDSFHVTLHNKLVEKNIQIRFATAKKTIEQEKS